VSEFIIHFLLNSIYQFQPRKQKKKENKDFDKSFQFTSAEHNLDPWNDLNKYIKSKPNTKLDDKIKKIRKEYQGQVCIILSLLFVNYSKLYFFNEIFIVKIVIKL